MRELLLELLEHLRDARDPVGLDPPAMVSAAELAAILGVTRDWVYTRASRLGAVRLGGKRGRLRFELETVRQALENGLEAASASPTRTGSQASNRPLQSHAGRGSTPAVGASRPKPRPRSGR
jgi:hypothetical protein